MNSRNKHVVPHDDSWAVRSEGSKRVGSVHRTQSEAIDTAREQARQQKGELFIHNRKGQIRERDSYGNDPFPPEG